MNRICSPPVLLFKVYVCVLYAFALSYAHTKSGRAQSRSLSLGTFARTALLRFPRCALTVAVVLLAAFFFRTVFFALTFKILQRRRRAFAHEKKPSRKGMASGINQIPRFLRTSAVHYARSHHCPV